MQWLLYDLPFTLETACYLLTNFINHRVIVKTITIVSFFRSKHYWHARLYYKATKQDFNPDFYIFLAGPNGLSLHKDYCEITDGIVNVVESLKSGQNTVAISVIAPCANNLRENVTKVNKLAKNTAINTVVSSNFLAWKFCGKAQFWHSFGCFCIALILHDKIDPIPRNILTNQDSS